MKTSNDDEVVMQSLITAPRDGTVFGLVCEKNGRKCVKIAAYEEGFFWYFEDFGWSQETSSDNFDGSCPKPMKMVFCSVDRLDASEGRDYPEYKWFKLFEKELRLVAKE